jgi:peptidoglycan/LPS O-acetylase OafA/YrhL
MAAAAVAGSLTTPAEAAPIAERVPSGEHVPAGESPRGDRLPGLDGLRGIAVLAVIVYHADLGWLPGGFLGVDVFFVISGFLITTLLLAERERLGRIGLRAFWMRRARRLLPALFLVLAATLTLAVVLAPDEVARLRGDTLAALGYVTNWYLIVRQQSYFEAMGRPSPLLHLWSLAVEEQFYVVWPLVLAAGLLLVRRRGMLVASLAGATGSALLMAWLYRPGVDPSRVYYGTDTHATGLLLGAALALAWTPVRGALASVGSTVGGPIEPSAAAGMTVAAPGVPVAAPGVPVAARGPRDLPPWPEEPVRTAPARRARSFARTSWDLLGVAGLLVVGLCFVLLDEYDPVLYPGGFVVLDLATAAVIVAAVHASGRLGTQVLDRQPLRWIGERSYGIYLWHWPIFTLTRPNLDVPLDPLPDLLLRVALTLVAAEASYRFVETPIRRGALGRAWCRWRSMPRARRLSVYRWPLASGGAVLAVALVVGARVAGATPPPPPPYLAVTSIDTGGASGSVAPAPTASAAAAAGTALPGSGSGAPGDTGAGPGPGPGSTASGDSSALQGAAGTGGAGTGEAGTGASPGTSAAGTSAPDGGTMPGSLAVPGASPSASASVVKAPRVLAIGDSVMLGAVSQLRGAIRGIEVDAAIGRPFGTGIAILQQREKEGLLPGTVVIGLGDNGWITSQQVDQAMQVLGSTTKVVFVNLKEPRSWESHDNAVLAQAALRYPNVSVADWHDAGDRHPEYFWDDGIHLRPAGAQAYAQLVAATLPKPLPIPSSAPSPTPSPSPGSSTLVQAGPSAEPAVAASTAPPAAAPTVPPSPAP